MTKQSREQWAKSQGTRPKPPEHAGRCLVCGKHGRRHGGPDALLPQYREHAGRTVRTGRLAHLGCAMGGDA